MRKYMESFPPRKLKEYRPELRHKPKDFDAFWQRHKQSVNEIEPHVAVEYRSYPAPTVDVFDLIIDSWDGTPLHGVLVKPKGMTFCPVMLSFAGYTGDRGRPIDYLKWTSLGVAIYSFDIRGQGDSPDHAKYPNGSRIPGWILQGIKDPEKYYYTHVYKDILLQLKWIRSNHKVVNPSKIGLVGSSQGGGLALSTAGLDGNIDFVVADYPFITHFEKALEVAKTGAYLELINYFKIHDPQHKTYDQVMQTLGYVDSLHFCEQITCPVLMSTGLEDTSTPSITAFAVYNHIHSREKTIEVYPNYMHEGIPEHEEKKLTFIRERTSE